MNLVIYECIETLKSLYSGFLWNARLTDLLEYSLMGGTLSDCHHKRWYVHTVDSSHFVGADIMPEFKGL
eukprot:scaffold41217_cov37-Prasinocladus_malaysianus.AAC.1